MKTVLLSLCCLLLTTLPCFADGSQEQALAAAQSFTALLDDGNLQAAYWSGSPLLRLANAEQSWLDRVERSQLVLGKVIERKLNRSRAVTKAAYLPDDDYWVILFSAQTEHKAEAIETLLAHQVNGSWQVCSYTLH